MSSGPNERCSQRMATGGGTDGPTPPADPWEPIVAELLSSLAAAFAAAGVPATVEEVRPLLDFSESPEWDLALPLHRFAARARRAPAELATALAAATRPSVGIAGFVAVGPYLNVRADRTALADATLRRVLDPADAYGRGRPVPAKVCVEHTSANPNGPFHIGRIRNALLGDSFARTLRWAGFPVTTQYYVDDLGRQAAMIVWIWSRPRAAWPPEVVASLDGAVEAAEKPDRYLGRPYPAVNEYLKGHPEADAEVQAIAHALESGRGRPEDRAVVGRILDGMRASLQAIGVGFDEFVWESELVADGSVDRVVARLRAAPHAVREPNGAWAIDATGAGLPQESARIIVTRGDGSTLYVTRDVAYHLRKFSAFDRVVDVLGANHLLHAKVLAVLLGEIGEPRRPEIVLYQYITAGEGGGMSTRRGTAVYLDDLLEEAVDRAVHEIESRRSDLSPAEVAAIAHAVGAGAVRYHILRVAAEKTVAFRWEEAVSFEGRSGPFVQYAYARASSILRKAERTAGPYPFETGRLARPEEWTLLRRIARFPGLVQYVARSAHVHALAGYAHQLAEEFNRFYQEVPVLSAGPERDSRVALVAAVRRTLGHTLDLLGVDRLDRM